MVFEIIDLKLVIKNKKTKPKIFFLDFVFLFLLWLI